MHNHLSPNIVSDKSRSMYDVLFKIPFVLGKKLSQKNGRTGTKTKFEEL